MFFNVESVISDDGARDMGQTSDDMHVTVMRTTKEYCGSTVADGILKLLQYKHLRKHVKVVAKQFFQRENSSRSF